MSPVCDGEDPISIRDGDEVCTRFHARHPGLDPGETGGRVAGFLRVDSAESLRAREACVGGGRRRRRVVPPRGKRVLGDRDDGGDRCCAARGGRRCWRVRARAAPRAGRHGRGVRARQAARRARRGVAAGRAACDGKRGRADTLFARMCALRIPSHSLFRPHDCTRLGALPRTLPRPSRHTRMLIHRVRAAPRRVACWP